MFYSSLKHESMHSFDCILPLPNMYIYIYSNQDATYNRPDCHAYDVHDWRQICTVLYYNLDFFLKRNDFFFGWTQVYYLRQRSKLKVNFFSFLGTCLIFKFIVKTLFRCEIDKNIKYFITKLFLFFSDIVLHSNENIHYKI